MRAFISSDVRTARRESGRRIRCLRGWIGVDTAAVDDMFRPSLVSLFGEEECDDRSHREWHSRTAGALAKGALAHGGFTKGACAKRTRETGNPSRLSAFEFLLLVDHLGLRVCLLASDLFQWPHREPIC